MTARMTRAEALEIVASVLEDELVICNIGAPSQELCAIADRPGNFYMLGSMGQAAAIGLGLALARPRRPVLAIEGDGAVLTSLGTLATIAGNPAANFTLLILDNASYGSTGDQPTHTAARTDLAAVARGCGAARVVECAGEGLAAALGAAFSCGEMTVIVCKIAPGNRKVPVIGMDPVEIRCRFMDEVRRERP